MGQMGMGMGMMNMESMQTMMKTMMPSPGDAASTKDFKSADMKMMQDMAVPYTGNADIDFRAKMIPHHQGAIDMAKVALAHAKDETTKALAVQIIKDQEREIAEMREWLSKNPPK
ncbi:CopM family metallochaperone [Bosea lupini]